MSFFSKLIKKGDPLGIDPVNKKVVSMTGGGKKKGGGTVADQFGPQAMAALDAKYPGYRRSYNDAGGARALGGRSFEAWLTEHFRLHPQDSQNQAALADLNTFATTGTFGQPTVAPGAAEATVPAEQGLFNLAQPGLLADIERDKERRTLADTLGRQTTTDINAARETIQGALGPTFDSEAYFSANPDVAAAFANNSQGKTPAAYAQEHYEKFGKAEGRAGAYTTLLQRDNANADRTAQAVSDSAEVSKQQQLEALAHYVTSMKQSLSGELRARAEALENQIRQMGANLDTFDEAQLTALGQQLATEGQALEQSIDSRRENLATQVAALRDANGAQGQARLAALNTELETLRNSNSTQDQARKAALMEEIEGLRTANTAQGQARLAALEQEITGLHAANEPLATARMQGAENAVTAVNIGLQRQQDLMAASQAEQGFIGGSTLQDAAMARSAIDARQQAAKLVSDARTANATDTRDVNVRSATEGRLVRDATTAGEAAIAGRSATEGRSLAEDFAANQAAITNQGATDTRTIAEQLAANEAGIAGQSANDTRTLSDAFATGKQQLASFGAGEKRKIGDATAAGRFALGNAGATQTFNDAILGATEGRKINDTGAGTAFGINQATAQTQQAARNAGAVAKSSYYDADFQRKLGTALQLPALTSGLTSTLTGLDDFASSGLNRSLNTFNWWAGGGQAPAPQFAPVNPSQGGNNLSSLGTGLVGTAINIGNANRWWQGAQQPTPVTPVVQPPQTLPVTSQLVA